VLGLADGIAAPAEGALGLALAEAQFAEGPRDELTAAGAGEVVSGLSDQGTHVRTQFHDSASLQEEADNVQESEDQTIGRSCVSDTPPSRCCACRRGAGTAGAWPGRATATAARGPPSSTSGSGAAGRDSPGAHSC